MNRQYVLLQVLRVVNIFACMLIGSMMAWGAGDRRQWINSSPYDRLNYEITWIVLLTAAGLLAAIIINAQWLPLPKRREPRSDDE